jgi:hypothetical protein
MKFAKMAVFGLVACLLFADFAEAQLFRRNIQRTRVSTVQSCPGGICPQANVTRSVQITRSNSHLTFPGTIAGHLQASHGVSVAGMSREQILSLHDSLHEARVAPTVAPALPKVQPVQQPTPTPRPVSSDVTFGLDDIYSSKSTEIPKYVLAQVDEPAPVADDPFRKTLAKAIADARKKGTINLRDAVKLRVAMMSPAFIERAKELAVTQVAFSGIESEDVPIDADGAIEVDGINWEGLAVFLEKLVPLILALLKAFGV